MSDPTHDARSPEESAKLIAQSWRMGRRIPRHLYAGEGDEGVCIGILDSAELCARVVVAHNAVLAWEKAER